jgi:putative redox protein
MKKNITVNWREKMAFEADIDGHKIVMDASPKVGGENNGPTPKPLLMASLGGCTAMDVISIARKMRQDISSFEIELTGEIEDEFPKPYASIHMIYKFKGNDLDREKLDKAVNLSQDRYCGVSATLRKAMGITHEIVIS